MEMSHCWQAKSLEDLMFRAITENRVDFVKFFLEKGESLSKVLNKNEKPIQEFYKWVCSIRKRAHVLIHLSYITHRRLLVQWILIYWHMVLQKIFYSSGVERVSGARGNCANDALNFGSWDKFSIYPTIGVNQKTKTFVGIDLAPPPWRPGAAWSQPHLWYDHVSAFFKSRPVIFIMCIETVMQK